MTRTSLGRFLYSERIRRQAENITRYVTERQLPISESYYRDIETGRKLLRVESALKLCEALDLDKKSFFFYLLKDILPQEVFSSLVKASDVDSFDTAGEELQRLTDNVEKFRVAYEKKVSEEPFEVDSRVVTYLNNNIDVLPLIHFIYMRHESSFEEIQCVMDKNNLERDLEDVLAEFEKHKLAIIDKAQKRVRRHARSFKIPRTKQGMAFKDQFFMEEIRRAVSKKRSQHMIAPNNSFIHSMITCIVADPSEERIRSAIVNLRATLDSEESDLSSSEAKPYFVSIVVSSREEYDSK